MRKRGRGMTPQKAGIGALHKNQSTCLLPLDMWFPNPSEIRSSHDMLCTKVMKNHPKKGRAGVVS